MTWKCTPEGKKKKFGIKIKEDRGFSKEILERQFGSHPEKGGLILERSGYEMEKTLEGFSVR